MFKQKINWENEAFTSTFHRVNHANFVCVCTLGPVVSNSIELHNSS